MSVPHPRLEQLFGFGICSLQFQIANLVIFHSANSSCIWWSRLLVGPHPLLVAVDRFSLKKPRCA
jgi:hypothetical protein